MTCQNGQIKILPASSYLPSVHNSSCLQPVHVSIPATLCPHLKLPTTPPHLHPTYPLFNTASLSACVRAFNLSPLCPHLQLSTTCPHLQPIFLLPDLPAYLHVFAPSANRPSVHVSTCLYIKKPCPCLHLSMTCLHLQPLLPSASFPADYNLFTRQVAGVTDG